MDPSVRKWALWAWVLLTAGMLFGARWAYVELGWGGYWAWDPVENASLLPWLVGTAYLHSVVVQEKRGMLRVWNVSLAVAAFAMSIFGTFLTRSGIISSVHAFAESSMGPLLIGFTFLTVAVGTALIVWRLPALRASGRIASVVSREASFLLTNLLFVGMTIVVLWGTITRSSARPSAASRSRSGSRSSTRSWRRSRSSRSRSSARARSCRGATPPAGI